MTELQRAKRRFVDGSDCDVAAVRVTRYLGIAGIARMQRSDRAKPGDIGRIVRIGGRLERLVVFGITIYRDKWVR